MGCDSGDRFRLHCRAEPVSTPILILKVAGSLYVFWLAWKLFRAGALEGDEDARPASFADGVTLLLLNPKAYMIIAMMFTQFLDKPEADRLMPVLLITTVFTLNNLNAFSAWALAGDTIAGVFRSPDSARRLNVLFGAILAIVAVWMLFS